MKKKTDLSAPVAEIIYPDNLPPTRFVEVGEKRADDGASEVTDMEGLGNVRGGVLNDRLLFLARRVGPVLGLPRLGEVCLGVHIVQYATHEGGRVDLKVQESLVACHRFDPFVRFELSCSVCVCRKNK